MALEMTTELTTATHQSLSTVDTDNEEDLSDQNILPYEYEYEPVCCSGCCIQKRRKSINEHEEEKDEDEEEEEEDEEYPNENLTLNEDIWALAYVIVRNRGFLPVPYCTMMALIYIIQVFSLAILIWGYSTTLNEDVIKKYEMRDAQCEWAEFDNDTLSINETNVTYTYDVSLQCDSVSLIEDAASTQEYVDDSASPLLFGFAVVLSWCLLSIYTLKTTTNPIMMVIIGYEYTEGTGQHICPCRSCGNCSNCCSSISGLLYGLAWANMILSMTSYATGFVILFGYPYYFGIDSPTDVILTPIGIVFILEIDDWAFEFISSFYIEREMDDLWTFTKLDFRKISFGKLHASIWKEMALFITVFTLCVITFTVLWIMFDDSYDQATDIAIDTVYTGYSLLAVVLLPIYLSSLSAYVSGVRSTGIVSAILSWRIIYKQPKYELTENVQTNADEMKNIHD